MSVAVNTRKVTGRRKLRFASLRDVLTDAERLSRGPYRQLGNWSLGTMCLHLARSIDSTTDDNQVVPPWLLRMIAPRLKRWILANSLPAGVPWSPQMREIFGVSGDTETQKGLAALRTAVDRFEQSPNLPDRSPSLGRMSRADWTSFHCRHAETHLSFLVPQEMAEGGG